MKNISKIAAERRQELAQERRNNDLNEKREQLLLEILIKCTQLEIIKQ